MRLVIALVASVVLLAGCGGGDDGGAEAEPTPAASESPSGTAEACEAMGAQLPKGETGDWGRVLDEAEHYTDSDDAEVRDLAGDVIEIVGPVAGAESDGASQTDWDRIEADLLNRWPEIAVTCGWDSLSTS